MKTLKQILEDYQEETEEIYWDTEGIKYCVKEWLLQKHQVEHSNMDSSIIHWNAVINELLEELQK